MEVGRENLVNLRVERGSKAEVCACFRTFGFCIRDGMIRSKVQMAVLVSKTVVSCSAYPKFQGVHLYTHSANKREAILVSDRTTANSVKTNKSSHQFVKSSPFKRPLSSQTQIRTFS